MKNILYAVALVFFPNILNAQWTQGPAVASLHTSTIYDTPFDAYIYAMQDSNLYRSHNLGLYWEKTPKRFHLPNFFALNDFAADTLYSVDNQDLYFSIDSGKTWLSESLNLPNWAVFAKQFQKTSNYIVVATGSGLFRKKIHTSASADILLGLGSFVHNSILLESNNHLWYNTGTSLFYIADEGDSIRRVQNDVQISSMVAQSDSLVYCTEDSLYRTVNNGQSFVAYPLPSIGSNPILKQVGSRLFYHAEDASLLYSDDFGLNWYRFSGLPEALLNIGRLKHVSQRGNHIMLAFSNAQFIRSEDAGESWHQTSTVYEASYSNPIMECVNNQLFIAQGYFSSNNKDNWTRPLVESTLLASNNHVFLAGEYYTILQDGSLFSTINGDLNTWEIVHPDTQSVTFSPEFKLFTANGFLYRSRNSTRSLERFDTVNNEWLVRSSGFDVNRLVVHKNRFFTFEYFLHNETLIVSDDEGITWTATSFSNYTNYGESVQIQSNDTILLLSNSTSIGYSLDGGNSFQDLGVSSLPTIAPLKELECAISGTTILMRITDQLASSKLFVSMDLQDAWYELQHPLTPNDLTFAEMKCCAGSICLLTKENGLFQYDLATFDFMKVSGTVYLDSNENGKRDSSESTVPNASIYFGTDTWTKSSTDGSYSFYSVQKTDTLRFLPKKNWELSAPTFYIVNSDSMELDFGLQRPINSTDVRIFHTNTDVYRPGFSTTIRLIAQNDGTNDFIGQVRLGLEPQLLYQSASPNPTAILGDTLVWEMLSIPVGGSQVIQVHCDVDVNTMLETPLCTQAIIHTNATDVAPDDNMHTLCDIVVGSYDPNDKRCVQGSTITPEAVESGTDLEYIIRFQNTGTYHAERVVVVDTLSQNLDLLSFQFLTSSHPCKVEFAKGRVVKFVFDSIFLPDSTSNEAASHGFIHFKIKPNANLEVGTSIQNLAYIFFDFNAAIITNTVETKIELLSLLPNNIIVREAIVYPNPVHDVLWYEIPERQVQMLRVFNTQGVLVIESYNNTPFDSINISSLLSGVYFISFYTERGIRNERFIKQ